MEQVNSWGRKLKNQISVTFKSDEEMIKKYINEKLDPSAYIKELLLKDMQILKDNKIILNEYEHNDNNNDDNDNESKIDDKAAQALNKMFNL